MALKRIYIPGDEWLYYKIYCGARTADGILTETISPLTRQLLEEALIQKWFFIRYNDPEFHLRVRFHLHDTTQIGQVLLKTHKALTPYVADDVVYKVQTDTYLREIERYGSHTMELSETLFYHESTLLLEAMDVIADEKLYFLFVLSTIDRLLDDFTYDIEQKLSLATRNSMTFKKEFHADKYLNKQLDRKYRGIREELTAFLSPTVPQQDYEILDQMLRDKTQRTTPIIQTILEYQQDKRLSIPLDMLVSSYIHMLVNRAFRSKQRFYELVSYTFLKQYYTTLKLRV
ncbi:MAG: thiopeptide-type bacteriocin biosynthesis protein [Bacteroidota bacterium]